MPGLCKSGLCGGIKTGPGEGPGGPAEQPVTTEQPDMLSAAAAASEDTADTDAEEHHLAFASDYHSTDGSIQNAMSGMPEDVEYVSLIGDMVGDRGNSHPEYEFQQILDLVGDVFPDLDSPDVSIVWATHDKSVNDEEAGIVKCMDGVSEPICAGTNADDSPAPPRA